MRPLSARALLVLGLLISACSYMWQYEVAVELGDGVAAPEGASVVMAAAGGGGELTGAQTFASAPVVAGQRSYSGKGTTCCAPAEVISLYAFIDLDGSGRWNPGEPWGADPNNPVTISNNDYVGRIVIVDDPADTGSDQPRD